MDQDAWDRCRKLHAYKLQEPSYIRKKGGEGGVRRGRGGQDQDVGLNCPKGQPCGSEVSLSKIFFCTDLSKIQTWGGYQTVLAPQKKIKTSEKSQATSHLSLEREKNNKKFGEKKMLHK